MEGGPLISQLLDLLTAEELVQLRNRAKSRKNKLLVEFLSTLLVERQK